MTRRVQRANARPALLRACVPWCWAIILTTTSAAHAQPDTSTVQRPLDVAAEVAAEVTAELGRLEGQRVRLVDFGTGPGAGLDTGQSTGPDTGPGTAQSRRYVIEDVAGEGAPVVGVVERRGQALWLVAEDGASYRLAGPLARLRITGPGYKIWALGAATTVGGGRVLAARRIGVLAPPWQRAQARGARRTIFAISAGAATRTGGPQ